MFFNEEIYFLHKLFSQACLKLVWPVMWLLFGILWQIYIILLIEWYKFMRLF